MNDFSILRARDESQVNHTRRTVPVRVWRRAAWRASLRCAASSVESVIASGGEERKLSLGFQVHCQRETASGPPVY